MHDLLPDEARIRRLIEGVALETFEHYGYHEIRLPLAEQSELYARSIGAGTDIVEKEVYSLHSRSQRASSARLSLRPEGTAGCLRAAIQHGLVRSGVKLWYRGEMFRHERPQKGRFRQFEQIGVEVIGMGGVEIDAELLSLGCALWRRLGVANNVRLHINSLGSANARARYERALVKFLTPRVSELDAESQRRLQQNPLRILDSKDQATRLALRDAPKLDEYWEDGDKEEFAMLRSALDTMEIDYRVDPALVRGLDYYGGLVFEWLSPDDGAQNAVAAGGRYDALAAQLGGPNAPAAGFAVGVDRLSALLGARLSREPDSGMHGAPDAYIVVPGKMELSKVLAATETLRRHAPRVRFAGPIIAGDKAQMRRARHSGAPFVLSYEQRETGKAQWRLCERGNPGSWRDIEVAELAPLLCEQGRIRRTDSMRQVLPDNPPN